MWLYFLLSIFTHLVFLLFSIVLISWQVPSENHPWVIATSCIKIIIIIIIIN